MHLNDILKKYLLRFMQMSESHGRKNTGSRNEEYEDEQQYLVVLTT